MVDTTKLRVYEQAQRLALLIYEATKNFPKSEMYGITSQIRGAAASIGANIAEGCGRGSKGELLRFFSISLGSAYETSYFLELSRKIGYLTEENFEKLYNLSIALSKQIYSFIRNLKPLPSH